jgi:hypothetical protein
MAIQSFSVGQVLTAAQVNALQANDYNQTVSNKTGSYTLVAADKGTRITMSSTSATTITVNTSLFSAGDTLFIQNLNAGISTITAGTATVTTASSLALAQWEGGTLYFTSTSAAIFIKGAGAAAASGGMTLINSGGTTLTGASITISSIPGTYKNLQLIVRNYKPANNQVNLQIRYNGDSGNKYATDEDAGSASFGSSFYYASAQQNSTSANGLQAIDIFDYTSDTWKIAFVTGITNVSGSTFNTLTTLGVSSITDAITSVTLFPSSGNFTSGTAYLYGVS